MNTVSKSQLLALFIGVIAVMLLLAGIATAGDYHMGTTLRCAQCHVMHASLTHGYSGGAPDSLSGPNSHLLKQEANNLCLECHDSSTAAPDVFGANINGYTRLAGALTTGSAPYEDYKGHTLGSTDTAPGGIWAPEGIGLQCIDCHDPHGVVAGAVDVSGSSIASVYRNLNTLAGDAPAGSYNVSYAIGANIPPTRDIFETSAALNNLSTHYGIANANLNEPNTMKSGMAEFCQKCHADFHSNGTVGGSFLRHPTAGVDVGALLDGTHSSLARLNSKTNIVKVMSPTGSWDPGALTGDVTPTCTTCHKAHGNQNAFGLIYLSGTGTVSEEGDAGGAYPSDLCSQCHVQR